MSGTSIDGVDLVYVRFSHNNSWSFKIINSKTYDYDNEWQYILKSLTTKDINSIKKIDKKRMKSFAKGAAEGLADAYTGSLITLVDTAFGFEKMKKGKGLFKMCFNNNT